MATLITDPSLEEQLLAERKASGGDRFDEVWEGVYVMAPLADEEHQDLGSRMTSAFRAAMGWDDQIRIYGGVNVSDRRTGWKQNFRCPDVAVVLPGSVAIRCRAHLFGGPDFAVEITSPGDRSREKLDFYQGIGVRELLIVDRNPWKLELYRLNRQKLVVAATASLRRPGPFASAVLPVKFRLVRDKQRPRIEVAQTDGDGRWLC